MKRHLLIAAIFLLAGAVVNVAVAWGCALWSTLGIPAMRRYELAPSQWAIVNYQKGFGAARLSGHNIKSSDTVAAYMTSRFSMLERTLSDFESYGVEGSSAARKSANSIMGQPYWSRSVEWVTERWNDDRILYEDGRGWPWISMWGTFRYGYSPGWPSRPFYVDPDDPAIALPRHLSGLREKMRVLPLMPRWRGFLLNTILYSTVLCLLVYGSSELRRFIRRRRGLCPACGYRMGKADVCSECGKALPKRARVTT